MRRHYRLMIPGPVEVDPEVLSHMSDPLQAHYGDQWVEIWNGTIANLKQVIGTSGEVLVVVGSGNTANDIVINSLFNPGDRVLVLNNGVFGQRLIELCEAHGAQTVELSKPWGVPFSASDIHEAVQKNPGLKAVLIVHGETSTGVANPIQELAQAARSHGLVVVADTIASLGGEPYRMDDWGIDVTVCASQKALEAPPGLGIIAVGERGWALMKERREPRGWMTDLQVLRRYATDQADFHPHPGTMPVNAFTALRKSTQFILDEGLEYRWVRHNRIARVVRAGVRAMGLRVLAEEQSACVNLTVVMGDGKFEPGDLQAFLKEQYGMQVARGIGAYFDKAIRVGHMGPNASMEAVTPFLVGLEQYLRKNGYDVPRGTCLAGVE